MATLRNSLGQLIPRVNVAPTNPITTTTLRQINTSTTATTTTTTTHPILPTSHFYPQRSFATRPAGEPQWEGITYESLFAQQGNNRRRATDDLTTRLQQQKPGQASSSSPSSTTTTSTRLNTASKDPEQILRSITTEQMLRKQRRHELRKQTDLWLMNADQNYKRHLAANGYPPRPEVGQLVTELPTESEPFEVFRHIGWATYRYNHGVAPSFKINDYMLSNEFNFYCRWPLQPRNQAVMEYYKQYAHGLRSDSRRMEVFLSRIIAKWPQKVKEWETKPLPPTGKARPI